MRNNKLLSFALVLGVGLFFGFLIGQRLELNQAETIGLPAAQPRTFSLMLDFGDGNIETFQDVGFTGQEKLFDALKRFTSEKGIRFAFEKYEGLGKLISQIGDKKNGDGGNYWQYWVNNRHADVGADQYVLKSGDVGEWKFIKFSGE